ncbi:MAG: hypothetical protein MUD01_11185 [Chloroflexaceae bacterium]|jgi:predicted regulator of Ras-like GTPase activity (Roadblock/LC7/MglB family)|nr:hypothetical protein [Chloroflexaceae bacterium]
MRVGFMSDEALARRRQHQALNEPALPHEPVFRLPQEYVGAAQAVLARLGYEAKCSYTLLADMNGLEICHWCRIGDVESTSIAVLAVGELVASSEISLLFGKQKSCSVIVQEYEEQTVLIGRVDKNHFLLMSTDTAASLGWLRLTLKRACDELAALNATVSVG